jgi:hypothetical protein
MARAVNLEVKLPSHVRPTDETNDQLIKKFLKECSKESLVQYLSEKSAWTRRFEKKSVLDRQKKLKYARNAKKYNQELNSETVKTKKKKKYYKTEQQQPQKDDK